MTRKKTMISFLIAIVMLFASMTSVNVYAAGEEVLPLGEYPVGSFTFTNTNLTKPKTMPNGAQKLNFLIKFKKADIDAGIGQVKLTVQVRDMSGKVVGGKTVNDTSGWVGGVYNRNSTLFIDNIYVSPGQRYQIFFDASSVNPSQSNGNYRSIQIISFVSYVNVNNIVTS